MVLIPVSVSASHARGRELATQRATCVAPGGHDESKMQLHTSPPRSMQHNPFGGGSHESARLGKSLKPLAPAVVLSAFRQLHPPSLNTAQPVTIGVQSQSPPPGYSSRAQQIVFADSLQSTACPVTMADEQLQPCEGSLLTLQSSRHEGRSALLVHVAPTANMRSADATKTSLRIVCAIVCMVTCSLRYL